MKRPLIPLGIAGVSLGMGLVGNAIESPGLVEGAEATGKFIAPAVNISMGGFLTKQIKDIKENIKKDIKNKKKANLF